MDEVHVIVCQRLFSQFLHVTHVPLFSFLVNQPDVLLLLLLLLPYPLQLILETTLLHFSPFLKLLHYLHLLVHNLWSLIFIQTLVVQLN
jgi:hypothetical protein